MMAKPMETLELHYPMIQFLIMSFNPNTQKVCDILALFYTTRFRAMFLPLGTHGSQKCYKLIDRFEAEVIVSFVLIGQF